MWPRNYAPFPARLSRDRNHRGDSSSAGGKRDPVEFADRVLVRHREARWTFCLGSPGTNER